MSVSADPQDGLFDRELGGAEELEKALEKRQAQKERASRARADYGKADESARALLGEYDLEEGETVRCGRFRLTVKRRPSRSVAFETEEKLATLISLLPED
jgi:hypothetical protein